MSIYKYLTYEEYFNFRFDLGAQMRGYRTSLANALSVHPSYVTRIRDGEVAITPDQAISLARFWQLNELASEYFLWLVLKGRSGNKELKKLCDHKLNELRQSANDLGQNLSAEKILIDADSEFFSSWIFPAICILLTLPNMNSISSIAKRLSLSEEKISSAVSHLEKIKLIRRDDLGTLIPTKQNIHFVNSQHTSTMQHKNWRIAAADRLGIPQMNDVRYSGLHSLSIEDFNKLKDMIQDFLLQVDATVRPSKEETVCVLCLDLFEL